MSSRKQQVEAHLPTLYHYLSHARVFGLYVDGTDDAPEIVLHFEGEDPPEPGEFPLSVPLDLDGVIVYVPLSVLPAGRNRLDSTMVGDAGTVLNVTTRERPCPGGFQITALGQATLGVNVDWPSAGGAFCLLCNNHAISGNELGVKVYQPRDAIDNLLTETSGYALVRTYPSPCQPCPEYNEQDLAWAVISMKMGSPYIQVSSTCSVLPEGICEPGEGERIFLVGARSGEQIAQIASTRYCTKVEWPRAASGQWAWFKDQILLDKDVTAPGDSGAVYVVQDGDSLVGIHVGANNLGSWGSPLLVRSP